MQNVFLSMTFLLTDLSRCCTRSTYSPWILLTQLDLVPKVLKVLVFMSNNHTYPRGWTPAWEIHWDCLYGKSHPRRGKGQGEDISFWSTTSLRLQKNHFQPDQVVIATDLPFLGQTLFLMDSSTPHWPRKWETYIWQGLHVCLTDGKISLLDTFACLPAYHCFSCHFHPRGLRVIITHAFRRAEHGMMGGLKVWETMKSFFNLRNYRFLKSYGRDWDSLSKMIKMAKISCLFNHLDLQANKLVPRALEGPSRKVCVTYWFLRGHLKRKKIPLEINPFFHIRPSHIFLPLIVPIFNIY